MEEILHELRLVVYPMIYKAFYIPGGCLGFLPSTVLLGNQYKWFISSVFYTHSSHLVVLQNPLLLHFVSLSYRLRSKDKKFQVIFQRITLPETNSSPLKRWWLEFGITYFQVLLLLVSGRITQSSWFLLRNNPAWPLQKSQTTSWSGESTIIYKVLPISGGCFGFLPSTVSLVF